MQKITPSLWFEYNTQEALDFYISAFPNSKIISIEHYPDNVDEPHMKGMEGKILNAVFELNGYRLMALDGGPLFKFNPSISFMLNFDPSKDENAKENLNKLWEKLSDGGKALMPLQKYDFSDHYGWIEDKFGISWQLILSDPNGEERPFIVPSLLFVKEVFGKAEEAVNFYTSVFKNSKIGTVAKYPAGMEPEKEGNIMYSDFTLENQWFIAMDSGQNHEFNFNEAISFFVEVDNQEELDEYWNKLSAVPESEQCGWLKDKFGVSWQIVPKQLGELLRKDKTGKVMTAMLKMHKIIIKDLEEAAQ